MSPLFPFLSPLSPYSYSIVEQYSPTIRQSNSVRFAVDIALAFSSNNYAKFFKLVR